MRISDWSSDVCSSDLQQAASQAPAAQTEQPTLHVLDGEVRRPLDLAKLHGTIVEAAHNLPIEIDVDGIVQETVKNLYDGVPVDEVYKSAILAARARVETDPSYSQVTARLLLPTIRKEVLGLELISEARSVGKECF